MNKIGNFLISLVIYTTCFISNGTLAGSKVYFVHSDHLSTPQVITDADQQVVWKMENQSAFGGETEIDQDPDGDGEELVFNLRFPGQYLDVETGLYYNYYRDYDPRTGRYLQSDPIGLDGGLNTYSYAYQNPLNYIDPTGLVYVMVRVEVSPNFLVFHRNKGGPITFKGVYETNTSPCRFGLLCIFRDSEFERMEEEGKRNHYKPKTPWKPDSVPKPYDGENTPMALPYPGGDGNLPSWGSPPNTSDKLREEFCRQNPSAAICDNDDSQNCS